MTLAAGIAQALVVVDHDAGFVFDRVVHHRARDAQAFGGTLLLLHLHEVGGDELVGLGLALVAEAQLCQRQRFAAQLADSIQAGGQGSRMRISVR